MKTCSFTTQASCRLCRLWPHRAAELPHGPAARGLSSSVTATGLSDLLHLALGQEKIVHSVTKIIFALHEAGMKYGGERHSARQNPKYPTSAF